MTRKATIRVPLLKVSVPLPPAALPRDIVPPDGPPGEPTIDLELEGGSLVLRARINGRNYRKMMKQIDEVGPESMVVVLGGSVRPPAGPGEPFTLEGAGFQAVVKAPKGGAAAAAVPASGGDPAAAAVPASGGDPA